MKVLFLVKKKNGFEQNLAPFTLQLIESLRLLGVEIVILKLQGKVSGLLHNHLNIKNILSKEKIDIIHAIYGLNGLYAFLFNKKPFIVSYIGSDVNIIWSRFICRYLISKKVQVNIFVSNKLCSLSGSPENSKIIPIGIDIKKFRPIDQEIAKQKLGLNRQTKYILFSSSFARPEKNSELAFKAIKLVDDDDIELLELRGYTSDEVNLLLNASELALMTSLNEGSPGFIKEALATNCPIISTDVGDVKDLLINTENNFVVEYDETIICNYIRHIFESKKRSNGRTKINQINSLENAKKIKNIYNKLLLQ